MPRPIVLVHGYSDRGESFGRWCRELKARGFKLEEVNVCSYESLTNEVTIKDIGEAFDRALSLQAHIHPDKEFDAIVHSTGMLVLRAWLTGRDRRRIERLKHLIALAPATFGSPLAHKGRSTLGSLFKGNRKIGPDFLEAGDLILDGLELASKFQWDLTHVDIFNDDPVYGAGPETPWVFTFCGTQSYSGLRRVMNEPGTDGTVRWAGCSLTCRKVEMDLTRRPNENRVKFLAWNHVAAPTVLVPGRNHATIVSDPPNGLVDLVVKALEVKTLPEYEEWQKEAETGTDLPNLRSAGQIYQQFVVRAVDERGDPIRDYHMEVFTRGGTSSGHVEVIEAFDEAPHPYRADPSLRCFHVNLSKIAAHQLQDLWLRILVSCGSTLVAYTGHGSASSEVQEVPSAKVDDSEGSTELEIDLSEHLPKGGGSDFFSPFTTTFVEIRFDREPYPFTGATKLLRWVETQKLIEDEG